MLTVLLNFLITLIGFGAGCVFFVRHKTILMQLLRNARLVIDYDYFIAVYRLIAHEHNYHRLSQTYGLAEPDEHQKIMHGSESASYRLLRISQVVLVRRLGTQLALIAAAPLLLGLVIGKLPLVAASILLAIAVMMIIESLKSFGTGVTISQRKRTVVENAYSMNGKRPDNSVPAPRHQSRQDALTQPAAATIPASPFAAYPGLAAQTNPLIPFSPATISEEPLLPLPASSKKRRRSLKSFPKPTWQNMWWGADAAVTSLLVANYWWNSAMSDGIMHLVLLTVALVAFVQLFFVPMWLTIRVSIRLIEAEHDSSMLHHQ